MERGRNEGRGGAEAERKRQRQEGGREGKGEGEKHEGRGIGRDGRTDVCMEFMFPNWVEWLTESLLVPSQIVVRSFIKSFACSVHCARGSTAMVASSGPSVGIQARLSVSKSNGRT